MPQKLLTTTEVALAFSVDPSTVRRWVAIKRLTPALTTPGGQYRFDPATIRHAIHARGLVP